ncbi:TetR family transcriptional regulator [Nocardia sp. NPDC050378]|uniref:TetR/AcrR family transcriptional regulator n=1 Tax=Nocardia sp. NPDC050378 TaxID=3155400 RepID=UPI0033F675DA
MSESGSGTAKSGRTGRRPGNTDTRTAILDAARTRFADNGFRNTSIRSIAADAEVDPALVHHYFGTKQQLFAAAVDFPADPDATLNLVDQAPLDQLGATAIRAVLTVWDSPAGPGIVAMTRSMLGSGEPTLAREFLLQVVLERVRARIATPDDDGRARVALAAAQMIGVLTVRKLVGVEPLASMPIEAVTEAVGPSLQRYLTGDIGSAAN